MKRKIAGAALLYLLVYVNRDQPAVYYLFTGDFTFARTAYVYERHLGALLPSLHGQPDGAITPVNVSHTLKAERAGMVVRINKDDHSIVLQHNDGSETEIDGVYVNDFGLFEKVDEGAVIGEPAKESVHITRRKNGQVISKQRMGADEID
ncbi:hypothetical protein BTO30_05875 [Domibacillus antri]|uniref:Peptidase M23 domain-containing protein n=1 Tax=Domibacillus antri TaxID=1714264 RepID=A0A1Q8Q813_9BACI|nr:hypothetical protein [Domibacillus antri]OLN23487.1 hypothetical protein BTO30_05875 [Domibacillus antri]